MVHPWEVLGGDGGAGAKILDVLALVGLSPLYTEHISPNSSLQRIPYVGLRIRTYMYVCANSKRTRRLTCATTRPCSYHAASFRANYISAIQGYR